MNHPFEQQGTFLQRRCPKCGMLLMEDAKFCVQCGNNLLQTNPDSLRGLIIGSRFEILEMIGEGGMGTVYKGIDMFRNKLVAIKAMLPRHVFSKNLRRRFSREAQSLFNVFHSNVVQFLAYFESAQRGPLLVMEFLEGQNADELLEARGRIPISEAVSISLDGLKGLYHLHSLPQPVVHRDVKPSNLRVLPDGSSKLIDLGIARSTGDEGSNKITRTGAILGTPEYMSPEQVLGMASVGPHSDQYSMGVTLFELLCRRTPFVRKTPKAREVHYAQVKTEPPDPREFREGITDSLAKAILRSLKKDPKDRFKDCFEMYQAVQKSKS